MEAAGEVELPSKYFAGHRAPERTACAPQKIPPENKIRLTEALAWLVKLYDTWEHKDKADEWRKKLPVAKSAKPAETKND